MISYEILRMHLEELIYNLFNIKNLKVFKIVYDIFIVIFDLF